MKKSILAFAVICAVSLAQATPVSWKSGVLYKPDGEGAFTGDKAKGTVTANYFLVANGLDSAYAGEWSTKSADELLAAFQSGDLGKAAIESSGALTSNNGGQANWTATSDTGNGKYAYVVAIYTTQDGDGNDMFIASGSSASVNTLGVQAGGSDIGAGVGSWSSPVGVPEPTSVALIALGLAALGLKRKVA